MKNLKIDSIIFSYVDESGSFDNVPKKGGKFETPYGSFYIEDVKNLCKYLDGGESPFTVQVICYVPMFVEPFKIKEKVHNLSEPKYEGEF